MIRDYIEKEDKAHPFSDQKLSDMFAADGLTVSKHLITKYRTALHIPPAGGRKVY